MAVPLDSSLYHWQVKNIPQNLTATCVLWDRSIANGSGRATPSKRKQMLPSAKQDIHVLSHLLILLSRFVEIVFSRKKVPSLKSMFCHKGFLRSSNNKAQLPAHTRVWSDGPTSLGGGHTARSHTSTISISNHASEVSINLTNLNCYHNISTTQKAHNTHNTLIQQYKTQSQYKLK